jgi:hypothetical protein
MSSTKSPVQVFPLRNGYFKLEHKVLYAVITVTSRLKTEPISESLKKLYIQAELLETLPWICCEVMDIFGKPWECKGQLNIHIILYCSILLHCVDLNLCSTSALYIILHYRLCPNWTSSGVQLVMLKEYAAPLRKADTCIPSATPDNGQLGHTK